MYPISIAVKLRLISYRVRDIQRQRI